MTDEVLLDRDGPLAWIRFNRPELGNAITAAQAEALRDILEGLLSDDSVRVVILTGSGSTFNVGAGGRPGHAPAPDAVARYEAQIPVMLRVIELLSQSRLVSIAAINGGCAGAGLAIALACDLRYAADTARFNTGFLSAGLSGELGAIWFATRLVGAGRARELFLLPDKAGAQSVAAIGLLTGVVPLADLETSVAATARRLADFAEPAVTAMKANFIRASTTGLAEYLPFELAGMSRCLSARGSDHGC